ncbi:hypothetical protein [Paenibacillus polymyxa]|uniref:Uncharacterized protein n=1 Tax=Paenibacillus polymyxa TaxID=1406 RepID=A0AAP3ZWQ8_PAEPO|nr:hypothetical protein [Paenibacillus polymyxa]MDH2330474.1 hypothetical protein [Paenibacillus polymyxa]
MSSLNNIYAIIYLLSILLLCILDWILYFASFKPNLNKHLNVKRLYSLNSYNATTALYRAYKHLSEHKFKILKMNIKSYDPNNNHVERIIDFFTKMIITMALAMMGYALTTSTSLLTYLNNNKNVEKPSDHLARMESIENIFQNFIDGYDVYEILFIIASSLFILTANHILINTWKKDLHKKHLTIIEEIERERS